ncbi:hypothetical protein TNIN_441221 [Trichonephila inaurata madagascariensis]|uniref:Uncharacterized protein n=1 Tax=Trichonephila inaurata madagascariensis TaxID=2747483 RepID=A0A8X7CLK0_9ARAC|nr:hypothetical protein TNIN_441221 [Trichonephila inaurata madagascariensis]
MPGNRKQFYFGEEDHKSDDKSVKVHVENRECASKQTVTSLLCIGLIGCTTKNAPIKWSDPFLRVLRPHGGVRDDLSVEIGHPSIRLVSPDVHHIYIQNNHFLAQTAQSHPNQNPLSTVSPGTEVVGKTTAYSSSRRQQPQKNPRLNLIISLEIRKEVKCCFKVKKNRGFPFSKKHSEEKRCWRVFFPVVLFVYFPAPCLKI